MAYLGFRAPLTTRKSALVLQTSVEDLIDGTKTPKFRTHALSLSHASRSYGIVSMEYDYRTGAVMILGNNPNKGEGPFSPMMWQWSPQSGDLKRLQLENYSMTSERAKPEALLLPRALPDRFFAFADSEQLGRQMEYSRSEVGLAAGRTPPN
jgi:hypothetical protein